MCLTRELIMDTITTFSHIRTRWLTLARPMRTRTAERLRSNKTVMTRPRLRQLIATLSQLQP